MKALIELCLSQPFSKGAKDRIINALAKEGVHTIDIYYLDNITLSKEIRSDA